MNYLEWAARVYVKNPGICTLLRQFDPKFRATISELNLDQDLKRDIVHDLFAEHPLVARYGIHVCTKDDDVQKTAEWWSQNLDEVASFIDDRILRDCAEIEGISPWKPEQVLSEVLSKAAPAVVYLGHIESLCQLQIQLPRTIFYFQNRLRDYGADGAVAGASAPMDWYEILDG
jgi:hypothetical protein